MASWSWVVVLVAGLVIYEIVGQVAHRRILMKHVEPLPADAPSDRFSEGRAMEHLYRLAQDIGIRQEGSPGLEQAVVYIFD